MLAPSRHRVGAADYAVWRGGDGPPLLLLHGFPETHACWGQIVPDLARRFELVVPDIRGYGESLAPPGGPQGEGYSKREMAAEMLELMASLGHQRFGVVGHDRGGRVAYRLALDHPERVERLVLLNIVPTSAQFGRIGTEASLGYWPWFLLAQPQPFPERMLEADPGALLDHVFATWPSDPAAIAPPRRAAYLAAMTPSTVAAMCADYRASFHLDQLHDAEDLEAGRTIRCPTLLLTGSDEEQLADAASIWNPWAPGLRSRRVPGGHFLPEEAPDAVGREILDFFAAEPETD